MITSEDLAFFTVLADSASLAEAARKLNVTPPAVSQRLQALELRAGVRLLDRTGRRSSLTDEGALVAAHGRVVADTIEALAEALGDRTSKVSGHLRVAAPHGFGRLHVASVVEAFACMHEGVSISLELSDHPSAQLIESCDVVVHIGPAGPPNQIMTTLAPNRRILCASPAYLERAEPVAEPGDLARHRCLVVRENNEDVTLWRFSAARRGAVTVRINPVMSSNDGAVVRDWALSGMGIAIRSEWNVADDIAQGRLCAVLPEWEAPAADVVAMLGSRHGRSARTTAFLTMLRQALNPAPWRRHQ
ncbi:DNA-binding transcriptional regulator, LysR family [Rhodoferax sp. OV413]|uniref:LysR family transcriptional regulator n=1 Tax=Rhodoferax sp. OV413 TaxID=1855285 RepID=UPI00088A6FCA|nr:LysR family transcriptional regulator [Rhodoferax sp. OV413]SDO69102.1 DNA-binding transcriptional regulator, LysR family [Rhodoferax sp. OV413]